MDILVNLFVSDQAAVPCRRQREVVFFQRGFHPSFFLMPPRNEKHVGGHELYWHFFISSWGRSTPVGSLSWEMVINPEGVHQLPEAL